MAALTLTDVLDVAYPGPPAWSADGDFLAATLYEDDGNALVFADRDGTVRWRLRRESGVDAFAWRPDGHDCLVRAGDHTLLVDPETESVRTLAIADEEGHAWSNDGDRIACYRDGLPWVLDVESGTATALDGPDRGPYLAEARTLAWSDDDSLLAYRFVDGDRKGVAVVDVARRELVYRTSPGEGGSCHTPTWLGDGRLCYERVAERRTVREFLVVDPAGGEREVLFRETDPDHGIVSRGALTVAPDGERLAVPLPLDGWDHLYVLDGHGDRTRLTAGPYEDKGLADSTPEWLGDDALVFASTRLGPEERGIYRVDAGPDVTTGGKRRDGTKVTPLVETPGTNVHPTVSPDGERLAYVHADRQLSPELRVRDLDADPAEPGTVVTRSAVADWDVDPVEPRRIVLPVDDYEVPAFLIDPRETDAVPDDATDLPAVVWVHGGPMRQMRDGWHPGRAYGLAYTVHQYLARKGYVGLLVNYRGGIGYGKRFRQAIADDPGAEVDVDVVAAADRLKDLPYVDPDAVAVWGLSYGGFATLRVLGTEPDAYDLGISLAGVADRPAYEVWATETKYSPPESSLPSTLGGTRWEAPEAWEAVSPSATFDAIESPLYSFHGTGDRYVDVGQQDLVVDALVGSDVDFEYEYYPDENHVFSERRVWRRVLERVETALGTELD
ncbi:prolyl oligopeptidase family serine peptidase [Halorubrum sp. JWXQ-INN 858]|uniref:prolyl oligopeptidase family serine peptidase n=1 Tax=Halorubrum sp. JWXQ-INN 858 TaxID=2690782 RepID=UPI001356D88D|nr:prolyl oligopeptidase family serine peptidase [Halorubrum sp. JWXQ-INN 858]MWV64949.1 prolyl oligopeptidase family serine peptidase [Halorubrum sp. JWXQ-INN 858]